MPCFIYLFISFNNLQETGYINGRLETVIKKKGAMLAIEVFLFVCLAFDIRNVFYMMCLCRFFSLFHI